MTKIKKVYEIKDIMQLEQKLYMLAANIENQEFDNAELFAYLQAMVKNNAETEFINPVIDKLVFYTGIFTIVLGLKEEYITSLSEEMGQYKAAYILDKELSEIPFIKYIANEYKEMSERNANKIAENSTKAMIENIGKKIEELDLADLDKVAKLYEEQTQKFMDELKK